MFVLGLVISTSCSLSTLPLLLKLFEMLGYMRTYNFLGNHLHQFTPIKSLAIRSKLIYHFWLTINEKFNTNFLYYKTKFSKTMVILNAIKKQTLSLENLWKYHQIIHHQTNLYIKYCKLIIYQEVRYQIIGLNIINTYPKP